jgi:hypothetical protein
VVSRTAGAPQTGGQEHQGEGLASGQPGFPRARSSRE